MQQVEARLEDLERAVRSMHAKHFAQQITGQHYLMPYPIGVDLVQVCGSLLQVDTVVSAVISAVDRISSCYMHAAAAHI